MRKRMGNTIKLFGKHMGGAVTTLSLIPFPGKGIEPLCESLPFFPFIGLCLGLILYGIGCVWNLFSWIEWSAGGALLMVMVHVILTRGLHLDGFADWADAIGAAPGHQRRLEIMKDTHLGTFGVLGLILVLMAKWIAFERLLHFAALSWVPLIWTISRTMMVELITTHPYARPGEGMARPFIEGASFRHRWTAHGLCLGLCLIYGPAGILFFLFALLITWRFGIRCDRRFGGITGDLIGTLNELLEICMLLTCALIGNRYLLYLGWGWI